MSSLVNEQADWSSLRSPGVEARSAGVNSCAAWRVQIPMAWWMEKAQGERSVFTPLMTARSALMSLALEVLAGRSLSTVMRITEKNRET